MTLWELSACVDGYNRAHAAKKSEVASHDRAVQAMRNLGVKGAVDG